MEHSLNWTCQIRMNQEVRNRAGPLWFAFNTIKGRVLSKGFSGERFVFDSSAFSEQTAVRCDTLRLKWMDPGTLAWAYTFSQFLQDPKISAGPEVRAEERDFNLPLDSFP